MRPGAGGAATIATVAGRIPASSRWPGRSRPVRRSASSMRGRLLGSPQRMSAFCVRFSFMSRTTWTGFPLMGW